jgi:shikimate kinase
LRENIVLIGFMGSGKSAIGRRLADRLCFRFVDTDRLVIRRAGMPIADIFTRYGEAHFRELETEALATLTEDEHNVIATGGGIVMREENHAILKRLGFVLWLTASEETIFERVSRNDKRPLLRTRDPRATVHELLTARRPFYELAAQATIDTTTLTHDEAADAAIAAARRAFGWNGEP